MALQAGTRLGPYEITGSLGAGGMGEVYRATDTKLGREVAIKTLPSTLASDKERLARFEREAKLLAGLNHAHIASVFSLDEHDGTLFLAMELVDGETLEQKLKAGALPVEDALQLALQIAAALEVAHANGVVHRDLKPANIMVTPNGQAKVLDFGLAKAFSGNPSEASPAHSPALSMAMTQQGLVLGTAGYMSPEQASGQATDQRADVWAFGVVLYEMLTGLPLFSGESVPHILADVLRAEPDWDRLPARLHPRLKLLLERCLAKRPHQRLHSIADARIEIETVLADPAGPTPAPADAAAAQKPSRNWRLAAAIAGTAVVAGLAGWLGRPVPEPAPEPVVRFSMPLTGDQGLGALAAQLIGVSTDGTRIAYAADGQIYLRNVADAEARPVPGTAEPIGIAVAPTFSPDGQWLAYINAVPPAGPFVIKRVPISGGTPVTVNQFTAPPNFPQGLTWPTADTMLFANADGIVRIPSNGGAAEVLVALGENERFYSPQLLPGGEAVLYTRVPGIPGATGGYENGQVVVQSIGGDDPTVVWDGASAARYLPSGHLVYALGGALFAVAFDPSARAIHGGPVSVAEGLRRSGNGFTDTANFAVSDTGMLALIPGNGNAGPGPKIETTLAWVDRDGREEPFAARPDDYTQARISPDGSKVALVVGASLGRETTPAIWIYDLQTQNLSLLRADPAGDDGAVWSPDGSHIYFRSARGDAVGVHSIDVDTGETTLVASSQDYPFALPWSIDPDDRTLALVNAQSMQEIHVAALSLPEGEFSPLLNGAGSSESEPSIAPNGAWIAYSENTLNGNPEINIRPFPDVSRTRIPVGPGQSPVFSRDGSELFFFDGSSIASASISYEPALRVGTPRRLFESKAYLWNLFGRTWDADPSGERFLVIRQPGATEAGPEPVQEKIDVVLNWFEELKSRVPVE